jgi:hypothetical protein
MDFTLLGARTGIGFWSIYECPTDNNIKIIICVPLIYILTDYFNS